MAISTSKVDLLHPDEVSGETVIPESVHSDVRSDVRSLAGNHRSRQLQETLDRAVAVSPADLDDYFKTASQAARSALEFASGDDERGSLLELWAQLDIAEAESRSGATGSSQLQEAVRKLEQALHAAPDRVSAWQTLAAVLVNQVNAPLWEDAAARLGERLGALPSSDGVAIARGKVLLELGRLCAPANRALCLEYAALAFDRAVLFEASHDAGWLQAAYAAHEAASAAAPAVARRLLSAQLERLDRGIETASLGPELTAELRRLRARAHVRLAQLLEGEAKARQWAAAGGELSQIGVDDPRDVRVYEDWAQALAAEVVQLEAASARELLHEAAVRLRRALASEVPDESAARLSTSLGLVSCALAERSAAAEAGVLAAEAEGAFRSATERWPGLEAAWSHGSELLLSQARATTPAAAEQLRLRVLETLWRGIRAVPDSTAACRLALARARTLVLLAEHGTVAEREGRYEEARREFEHAAERDPANWRGWGEASDVLAAQAKLSPPSRGRQALERALELLAKGLRAVEAAGDDAAVSHLLDRRGSIFAAFGPTRFEDAARQYELASHVWDQNPAPWLHAADLLCIQAEPAEPALARELWTRAFDQLTRGLSRATEQAESRLLEARARLSLRAAELEVGAERGRRLEEAAADLKRACDLQPSNAAAWRTRAAMSSERALRASAEEAAFELWKQADEVLDAAMQSIPLGEATAALLTDRGNIFVAQAKRVRRAERRQLFERAVACFEEATQLAPGDGRAFQCWGRALAARGRYDATVDTAACFQLATERFREAGSALPLSERGAACVELAAELAALARRDVAIADPLIDDVAAQLQAALHEDERRGAVYYLARGKLLREAGRYADAEADFTRGRDAAAPVREALFCQHQLSALLESRGRAGQEWRRTQRGYASYCAAEPADAEALGYAGVVAYEVFGDYDLAERRFSDAIARWPANGAWLQLIWSELARERGAAEPAQQPAVGERLREAERYIRKDRLEQPARELSLGQLALWSRDYERADYHFQRARELDPWNADAELAFGQSLLEQGKLELARVRFEQARKLAPRELRVLVQLAKASELEGAQQHYRELLLQSPHHPDALLGLCHAHSQAGDARNDRDSYARAIEYATAAIGCAGNRSVRRVRASELARAHYARGYAQLKIAALEARYFGVDRAALARADFRSALRRDRAHLAARDALAKLGPELGILHRHAGTFICALAIGLFTVAQLGFWFAADPLYQLCAGDACLPAFRLRTLEFGGYAALTFGALAFVVLGLALPRWLRQVPVGVDLESPR